jgi:hypothetical protein
MGMRCRWDTHHEVGFCSDRVEILFRAVYDTNSEIGAMAAAVQKRSVIDHIAELVSLSDHDLHDAIQFTGATS